MPPERSDITGLVLAGGRGSRFGGRDKGLVSHAGQPLIVHALNRLAPQVGPLLINANRNNASYADYGYEIVPDRYSGFPGPLAGLHAGLMVCVTPYLVCVPCDAPEFPGDLVQRLAAGMSTAAAVAAFAVTTTRRHPTFMMVHRGVLARLEQALDAGLNKVETWCRSVGAIEVPFADESSFANLNHPGDLAPITFTRTAAKP